MATLAKLSLFAGGILALADRPNFVFILADDLNSDWKNERLGFMPNLKRRFSDGGAFFENHAAVVPVCGPSRSSLLTGRYPHNTGYLQNGDLDSYRSFCSSPAAANNANNSVGRWLREAGYYTAFFGKYVNNCEHEVPYGWSHWGGFLQTYNFYNASMYDMTWEDDGKEPEEVIRVMTGVHQADFLGNLTVEHAERALNRGEPFFVHVTPVMPHWGTCFGPGPASVYPAHDPHWEMAGVKDETGKAHKLPISPCPSDRHRHAFDGQTNPHIQEAWNVSIAGPRPEGMLELEKAGVSAFEALREDLGWQNRSASLLDLDYMIGVIMDGLEDIGALDNTYVFFSSDNGYHLGEHRMVMGKGHPYETDVSLPMYVAGPTVKPGATMRHPTTHLDITATIVELSGAKAGVELDGLSFASELAGGDADAWRQFSYSEFFSGPTTWRLVRVVNSTHRFSHSRWCTGDDTETFDLLEDPWQTSNLAGQPGPPMHIAMEFDSKLTALGSCTGSACHAPVADPGRKASFECYWPITKGHELQGSFRFKTNTDGNLDVIRGWAVDFFLDGPGSPKPSGFSPIQVWMRMDGEYLGERFQQIANITRKDLNESSGVLANIPNLEHGFEFKLEDLPTEAFSGKHQFDVVHPRRIGAGRADPICNPQSVRCLCDGKPCDCIAGVVV